MGRSDRNLGKGGDELVDWLLGISHKKRSRRPAILAGNKCRGDLYRSTPRLKEVDSDPACPPRFLAGLPAVFVAGCSGRSPERR